MLECKKIVAISALKWPAYAYSLVVDVVRQDDKADVILKYMPDEARLLKAYGELPDNIRLNEGVVDEDDEGGEDDYVDFGDEDIDKI